MSESDTMFNERDRRCAAVQLMLSTDPSYDNRTIASTLENITNMTSHNTKASLIAAIRRLFELPPALGDKSCSQFRIRIEAVIEAEGSYIE